MKLWILDFVSKRAGWERAISPRQAHRYALGAAMRLALYAMASQAVIFLVFNIIGGIPFCGVSMLLLYLGSITLVSLTIGYVTCYSACIHIIELNASKAQLREMSRIDMLSGLLNRRAFLEAFDARPERASLVVFDVDRFKNINDRFGHGAGDVVIVTVADVLRDVFAAHEHNMVSRLGGEEFAVLSCNGQVDGDAGLAELARSKVEMTAFDHEGQDFSVTISGGLVNVRLGASFSDCFAAADKALYRAKQSGRNRVERAPEMAG